MSEPRSLSEANKGASERGRGSARNESHPDIDGNGININNKTKEDYFLNHCTEFLKSLLRKT